jgi:hypothetical protein
MKKSIMRATFQLNRPSLRAIARYVSQLRIFPA